MGSPENYYGVFGLTRGLTSPSRPRRLEHHHAPTGDTGWVADTTAPAGTPWTASSGTLVNAVKTNDNVYAQTTTNRATQQWSTFGLP